MRRAKMKGLSGDEAVAYGVKQADVDVLAAYPITPQTIIVEKFSEFYSDGEVKTEFVPVESEHSALSACIGASAVGARTFTATASQGLALMHEIVYIASGLRLPIVMAVVNRALSAPINIHGDHSDMMAERDSGWIQLFVEDAQEAYDTTLQSFKIAESVHLPIMYGLDGFTISHTLQRVEMLSDQDALKFVGRRELAKVKIGEKLLDYVLDPENPLTLGPLSLPDYYFEHKRQQEEAIYRSSDVIKRVNEEYGEITGRYYGNGLIEPYDMEDAEYSIICMGSAAGTAKEVVGELRAKGKKVGLLRVRTFRPFPKDDLLEEISGLKGVAVMDRSGSYGGIGGPLFSDVRNLLNDLEEKPTVSNYIFGLGGRDVTMEMIAGVYRDLEAGKSDLVSYLGVEP
jgi:pyruvate ferredoxin oxidoreductase alpha subunit